MRRLTVAFTISAAALTLVAFSLGYSLISQPRQLDTSWIPIVTLMLEEAKPYPVHNGSDPGLYLSYCRIYLLERGNLRLVYYGNPGALGSYLTGLLNQANVKKQAIDEALLDDKVLPSARVVSIHYRPVVIPRSQEFNSGYFILEDESGEGLTGKLIARTKNGLQVWEIHK